MDPFHGMGEVTLLEKLEDAELADAQREEEERRLAVARLLGDQPTPEWELAHNAERQALEVEVERRLMMHKEQLARQRQETADAERRARDASLAEAISHDPSLATAKRTVLKHPTAKDADTPAGELTLAIDMNVRHAALEVSSPETVDVDDATLREKFRRELETSRMISEGELGRGRCVTDGCAVRCAGRCAVRCAVRCAGLCAGHCAGLCAGKSGLPVHLEHLLYLGAAACYQC